MRFVIGLLLGFGIGLAAAILLAPEKRKDSPLPWLKHEAAGTTPTNGSQRGLRSVLDTVRERVNEALGEAKEAQREAEDRMQERYRKMVGKTPEDKK